MSNQTPISVKAPAATSQILSLSYDTSGNFLLGAASTCKNTKTCHIPYLCLDVYIFCQNILNLARNPKKILLAFSCSIIVICKCIACTPVACDSYRK